MQGFTPVEGIVGGGLMGLGVSLMLVLLGKNSGGSSVISGVLWQPERLWRLCFLVGMIASAAVFFAVRPSMFPAADSRPLWLMALTGVMVGFGTRVGSGCTTGHALGMARLSIRSITAVMTFFAFGAATATLWDLLGGHS